MTDPKKRKKINYAESGVNIELGNKFIDKIKPLTKATSRSGSISNIGGFGALFDLKAAGYDDPILVASTDGVGTKLRIATQSGILKFVGIDLVAMCVNDLVCQGAEPLFFLDYIATGKLNISQSAQIIKSIVKGCLLSNVALIGGETAEMPDMYKVGEFDLAGFAIGAMNRGYALPRNVAIGDVLVGICSSGFHSNGYSLIRKIVKENDLFWDSFIAEVNTNLSSALLEPTRIYVPSALKMIQSGYLNALAHITGGGISENLIRAIPLGMTASINLSSWPIPQIMKWLFNLSGIDHEEALRTFNCGIGMIAIVPKNKANEILKILKQSGENGFIVGEIIKGNKIKYVGALQCN